MQRKHVLAIVVTLAIFANILIILNASTVSATKPRVTLEWINTSPDNLEAIVTVNLEDGTSSTSLVRGRVEPGRIVVTEIIEIK